MRDTVGNFMWTLVLCVQIYTLEECLYMKTEGTHQNGTSTLLPCACPRAWVVGCSLVGIPPRRAFVFQSNVEELHQALSIIHLTCRHCNPPNPREAAGAGLQAETPEVWTVRTWMEGKPQQREREDDRWWARVGMKGKEWREGGRRGSRGVTGDCCRGSDRDGGQKKRWASIDILHKAVSLHLKGSLWL